jgi:phage terminase large subunit-like protein
MDHAQVDHVAEAIEYAQEVVAGLIPACKWVKAACRRQLDDLERWEKNRAAEAAGAPLAPDHPDYWPYEWRPDLADRVIRFKELWPHIKDGFGWRAGERITLEPWQKFKHACVFGWVNRASGMRRYRTVYEEVPRKNAKTTDLATTGLYLLAADGEAGAEVYSAATKEEQARIVLDIAREMVEKEPEFRRRFSVNVYLKAIIAAATAGKFVPLAPSEKLDGLNVSGALIDELHAHKTRTVHDVLDSGTGSRSQPLIWKITTAGSNRAGVCFDQRTYATKILNAVLKRHGGLGHRVDGEATDDERYFAIIYTIDEGDDPFDETTWAKANPNYGISVDPEEFQRLASVAMVQAQAQNEFLTKKLNIWVNADSAWMDMLAWDACADRTLTEEAFTGQPCVAALDAAFKKDLFAKVKIFRRGEHYYAFGRYYTSVDLTREEKNAHLKAWVAEGWIRATPGNVLDIEAVREELVGRKAKEGERGPDGAPLKPGTLISKGDLQRFQLEEVPYDPMQLTQFAGELSEQGVKMVELRPTVLNFSPAMKELEALVKAGRFHHNGDPVLAWAIANVVCHRDAKDNIYPRKDDAEKKIDPAIALLMALNRSLTLHPTGDMAGWLKNPVMVGAAGPPKSPPMRAAQVLPGR